MKFFYSKQFKKSYQKLSPKQQQKVDESLMTFEQNPFFPSLKNHALRGRYQGLRSLSAGGDLQIIFREKEKYLEVIFLQVGSHNQVY